MIIITNMASSRVKYFQSNFIQKFKKYTMFPKIYLNYDKIIKTSIFCLNIRPI